MYKVFIDGAAGTTGLRLESRLSRRSDILLLKANEAHRKDPETRRQLMAQSDVTFLCLPDDASRESVSLCDDPNTIIIDTSTAHRTAEGWVYGFSELSGEQKDRIRNAKRIANPGCHAVGFVSIAAPLTKGGLVPADYPFTCFSLTGYSGGGKRMIADYESDDSGELDAPGIYGLPQSHKHLPEMRLYGGLTAPPGFSPIVGKFYSGMATSVSLDRRLLHDLSVERVRSCLTEHYRGSALISVASQADSDELPILRADRLSGKDSMAIFVTGCDDRVLVTSIFDNLGKGASGSAIQNMNIALGLDETESLVL